MQEMQNPGRREGGAAGGRPTWRRAKKSELCLAMDSLRQGLKQGPGYLPLTPAAIRLAACSQCRQFDNPRLLGRNKIRCGTGGLLHVVHGRTALDYLTGRVTRLNVLRLKVRFSIDQKPSNTIVESQQTWDVALV